MKALGAALRQVLANRSIRHTQAGWFIATAAQWAYLVAVLVYAYDVGGVVAAGLASTVRMLPAAIAAPFTTMLADQLPPRLVLLGVHLGRASMVGLVAIGIAADLPAAVIFLAIALEGLIATLHRPTTMALLPALARSPQELIASNATFSAGEAIGVLVGPAVGGVLLAIGGVLLGTAVPAIGFVVAALVVLGIEPVSRGRSAAADDASRSRLAELMAGFAALRTYPAAGILISLFGVQTLVRGVLTVLLVAVSVEIMSLGSSGVGYLNAAIGAGALVGAFAAFTLVLRPRLAGPFSVALAFWGIPVVVLGLTAQPLIGLTAMAVLGLANAVLDVSGFSLIQRCVPNRLRGRVFGALEAIAALTFGIGSLLAPVLVALFGLQMALAVSGGLLPVLAVVTATLVRRADTGAIVPLRQLELLRNVPMFAPLPMTALEQVAVGLVPEQHATGVDVIRQGEPGECWYLIASGTADVIHDGERVAALGAGDGFGEIALLSDRPRTATVSVRETLDVFRLPRMIFLEAVTGSPHAVRVGENLVAGRIAELGHADH
jgi:MFS family permease